MVSTMSEYCKRPIKVLIGIDDHRPGRLGTDKIRALVGRLQAWRTDAR